MPDNTPSPYTLIICATTTERTLPAAAAAVRLNRIDGAFNDPEETLDAVDLIWDTGAHGTIIAEDILSAEFRQYLTPPLHDSYWCRTVRVEFDGEISFSNTVFRINYICLVVSRSLMPNGRVGIFLG